MLLQKIRLKGFLGHRGILGADGKADFVEVDFNDSPLWLIHGENGGGKSSLWDALTFAFFKQHRGSENRESASFKHLIHEKETDVAEIEVEFELDLQAYRICGEIGKTKRDGAVTNRVLYKVGEESPFQDGDSKVQAWLNDNLPFSFQTFTSAILLRQGEADKFLKAKATERKNILLKLLDLNFYEELRKKTTKIHSGKDTDVKGKSKELSELPNPTDEEIKEQNELVSRAKDELTDFGEQKNTKQNELSNAKDAAKWRGEIVKIKEQKAEDQKLFAETDLIEKEVARFRELQGILPTLEILWQYKNNSKEESENWSESRKRIGDFEVELKNSNVGEAKQRVEEFRQKRVEKQTAREEIVEELNEREIRLSSLRQNLNNRSKITGKEECPFCGSELRGHSQRLQEEIKSWEVEIKKIETEKEILSEDLSEIKKQFEKADKDFQDSEKSLQELKVKQMEHNIKLNAEREKSEDLQKRVEDLKAKINNCCENIPANSQNQKAIDDEAAFNELKIEKETLRFAEAKAGSLSEAFKRRERFEGELQRLQKQLDEILEKHPRAVEVVQRELDKVSQNISLKDEEITQANRTAEEMMRQKTYYEKRLGEQKQAERQLVLWRKLAEAFGEKGLKAQILQVAQEKVKIHANDTLEKLSNGLFEIELEDIAETEELKIYVRDWRTESLRLFELFSGGESLLLAVSLAVAIGQATHGRNIANTLIIDEGFAALDENNRSLMTKELTRLSDILEGVRVIVVSHQNDVINKFPNRYEIGKDKEGFTEIRRN